MIFTIDQIYSVLMNTVSKGIEVSLFRLIMASGEISPCSFLHFCSRQGWGQFHLCSGHFRKYTEIPIIFNKEHLEMELNLLSEFTVIKMEMAQP